MEDEFFEFDDTLPAPEPEADVHLQTKDYNTLNDETFGLDDVDLTAEDDDWELTHEKLAQDFDPRKLAQDFDPRKLAQDFDPRMVHPGVHREEASTRDGKDSHRGPIEEDLEQSISRMVLDDEDDDEMFATPKKKPQATKSSSSQPIHIQSSDSNLKHLYGPGSPPSLYDPNILSPASKENIWGAAHAEKAQTKSAEESLKALLHIGGERREKANSDRAWSDPSILQAVPEPGPIPPKVMTLEEIENSINQDPHPPPQPIGTPPRGAGMRTNVNQPMSPHLAEMVRYWTQKLHQVIGGRVSPTEISSMIIRMHQTSGRISPDYLHQMLIKRASVNPVVGSPNFSPRPNMMQHPPRSPFMPMPYPNQGRMQSPYPGIHQGSPMGRGMGMPPRRYPGTPRPNFNLTPMNPRIPPVRPATDPGPMRRGGWNRNQQYRGRPDSRYPREREYPPHPTGDEYANLMTQREKDWVIKIQMIQLRTDNPMVSDYYYQIFAQRKQNIQKDKDGDKRSDGDERDGGRGDADDRRGKGDERQGEDERLKQPKLEPRVYKPAQYEGALGRVTSASVNNPRQLIDVHHLKAEEEEDPNKLKEHSKKRKVLLSIEHMYDTFLKADDVAIQLNGLPESDTGALLEKRQQLLNDLYKSLRLDDKKAEQPSYDALLQILSVRKGRKLLSRLLPLLDHKQGTMITDGVVLHLLTLLKREATDLKKNSSEVVKPDETLPTLFRSMAGILECMSMGEVLEMARYTVPPAQEKSIVPGAIQHKFGLSLILCALSRAEALFSSTTAKDLDPAIIQEWAVSVNQFADAICDLPRVELAEPLDKYPLALEHFKHFVSKQSFTELEEKLRPITEEVSINEEETSE